MAAPETLLKLFGTTAPIPARRVLTAGPLSAVLEEGNLRHIRIGGREAIRAVSYIVRDHEWGTPPARIVDIEVAEAADGFTVTYGALCPVGDQEFRYEARIEGRPDGLDFTVEGTALTDILTARIGFVVLHPIDGVAGEAAQLEHVDGTREETFFPALIQPFQPFMELRAIRHQVAPGLAVTCRMAGDTFETEDQRNWTDASYKTYVRPIGLPWPFLIRAGETTRQSVSLAFEGRVETAPESGGAVRIQVGAASGRAMPSIGLHVEPESLPAPSLLAALADLAPGHLRCRFDPRRHGVEEMAAFAALGARLGAELALEAVLPCEGDLAREAVLIAETARAAGARFDTVVAVPAPDLKGVTPGKPFPPCPPLESVYAALRHAFPAARLGGGTYCFFTELNRKRPPVAPLDFITHMTGATYHAADDISVMETLGCLPAILKSAEDLSGGKGYEIGFAAIGCMDNPFGVSAAPNPENLRKPVARRDPRQRGLFGAAWTLGYLACCADSPVEGVTLGAVAGDFAVAAGPAELHPLYHVLRAAAHARGRALRTLVSDRPDTVLALGWDGPEGPELWLANLGTEPRRVTLAGIAAPARAAFLALESVDQARAQPGFFDRTPETVAPGAGIGLGPYAVCRLVFPHNS